MVDEKAARDWSIGERCRYLRQRWGLRQQDVQARGGPSRLTLIRLEQGKADAENTFQSTLRSLAKVLGCRLEWLLTGEGAIWAEGITPPEQLRRGTTMPRVFFKDLPPSCPEGTTDLGRWVTEGPVDWAVVARAIRLLDQGLQADPGIATRHARGLSVPLALQLLHSFLIQKDEPLSISVEPAQLSALLSAALR